MLTYVATWNLNGGFEPVRTRNSAHPSLVPFQAFLASDGWIVVGCAKEKFWQRLAEAVGHPEWVYDPRYLTFSERAENSELLLSELETIFRRESVAHWLSLLGKAGVPVGPVNNIDQALSDPHTLARNLIIETEHPRFGKVRQVASPASFGTHERLYRRAPMRNEDFSYVVRDLLGYQDKEINKFMELGAFGAGTEPSASGIP